MTALARALRDANICGKRHPSDGYICTEPHRHAGMHSATIRGADPMSPADIPNTPTEVFVWPPRIVAAAWTIHGWFTR